MPEDATSDQLTAPEQESQAAPDTGEPTDWKAEADKWKSLARKHEGEATKAMDRAKQNHAASKELEQLRQQSMTETEKAVAAARSEAAQETALRYGGRLVDAEVRAAAAGRSVDVPTLLEGLDRSRFLTDDGEPDVKAITAWVSKLAPTQAEPPFPDLGQGARAKTSSATPAAVMNDLLRRR